jgi:hypothetical protein
MSLRLSNNNLAPSPRGGVSRSISRGNSETGSRVGSAVLVALVVIVLVALVGVAAYAVGNNYPAAPRNDENAKRHGSTSTCHVTPTTTITAKYVMLGGGFGGLVTAYRMLKPAPGASPIVTNGADIVIVEAEAQVGGRVDDVLQNGTCDTRDISFTNFVQKRKILWQWSFAYR